jgi:hypothetical protein
MDTSKRDSRICTISAQDNQLIPSSCIPAVSALPIDPRNKFSDQADKTAESMEESVEPVINFPSDER